MTDDTRDPTAPPDADELDEKDAPIEDANDEGVEPGDVADPDATPGGG